MSNLVHGTPVKVKTTFVEFCGTVVGKGSEGVADTYVVHCTDGFIPNDNYFYDHCVIPLHLLEVLDKDSDE